MARAKAAVVGVDRLGAPEQVLADEGRDTDRNPLGGRPAPRPMFRAAATARGGGRAVEHFVPVKVQRADVGFVAQQAAHHAGSPVRQSRGAGMGGLRQPERDLADAQSILDVPGEDLPHHLGFGLRNLQVRGHAIAAGNAPIPIGHLSRDNLSLPGAEELAAPIALDDLHPLVLRDRPLDLHEQPRMGVVTGRGLEEEDPDVPALELLEDEDLIGVLAGEPIGAEDHHGLEGAGFRPIAELIQPRAIQATATVAVIDTHVGAHHLVVLFPRKAVQGIQLRGDRALSLLALRRDPRIACHSHGGSPHGGRVWGGPARPSRHRRPRRRARADRRRAGPSRVHQRGPTRAGAGRRRSGSSSRPPTEPRVRPAREPRVLEGDRSGPHPNWPR